MAAEESRLDADRRKALGLAISQIEKAARQGVHHAHGQRIGPGQGGRHSHRRHQPRCGHRRRRRSPRPHHRDLRARVVAARPRSRSISRPTCRRRAASPPTWTPSTRSTSEYAKKLGVDVENLLVSQPDTGEQALEIVEILVRSGAVDIVVIDSVAALVPKAEIEGEMGDSHMGLQARLMSQALRKLAGAINRSNCAVVFINQLREKIGVMFGNPETTTGGKALKFYASLRLDIRRIGPVKEREDVIGNHVRVKVVKNKVAPPFRQAEFDVMFDEGISHTSLRGGYRRRGNIIQKSGAWYSYGDQRIGQGRENAKLFLRDNPPLMTEVEGKVRDCSACRPARCRGRAPRTTTSEAHRPHGAGCRDPAAGAVRVDVDGTAFCAVPGEQAERAGLAVGRAGGVELQERLTAAADARPRSGRCFGPSSGASFARADWAAGWSGRDIRRPAVEAALGRAARAGLLDDAAFALDYVQTRAARGPGAVQADRRDLLAMGVERGGSTGRSAPSGREGSDRTAVPLALAAKRAAQLGALPRPRQAPARPRLPRAPGLRRARHHRARRTSRRLASLSDRRPSRTPCSGPPEAACGGCRRRRPKAANHRRLDLAQVGAGLYIPAMQSAKIRRLFLDFFVAQGHREVPSSSLVPADDPTLLFTNAGMVQFKRTFLGQEHRDYAAGDHLPEVRAGRRQAQRSRAGGPHQAAPHLLRDAGQLLLRRLFQARRDRVRLGVRHQPGVPRHRARPAPRSRCTTPTTRRARSGAEMSGLPDHRIYGLGDKDNFWQMGDTGPCGPCTEIYVDLEWTARRRRRDRDHRRAEFEELAEAGRFLEIWNLVFMQFDRSADGTLTPLPKPSVDTGAGLERIAAVMQGEDDNFHTDAFLPLIDRGGRARGPRPTIAVRTSRASYRVLADHARAVSFLLADGVYPGNEGRGYVLRRILRRAVRHAWLLGRREPTLAPLTEVVVASMGDVYPELVAKARIHPRGDGDRGAAVPRDHRRRASAAGGNLRRRARGSSRATRRSSSTTPSASRSISPRSSREERGVGVDRAGFERALKEQRERSRAARASRQDRGARRCTRRRPASGAA